MKYELDLMDARREGKEKTWELIRLLLAENRKEELFKAANDIQYQDNLFQQYHLTL